MSNLPDMQMRKYCSNFKGKSSKRHIISKIHIITLESVFLNIFFHLLVCFCETEKCINPQEHGELVSPKWGEKGGEMIEALSYCLTSKLGGKGDLNTLFGSDNFFNR